MFVPVTDITPEPRFTLTITPEGTESRLHLTATAAGVTYAEVVYHIVRALTVLTPTPQALVPTAEQIAAEARRVRALSEYPVRWIAAGPTGSLYLSDVGLEALRPLLGKEYTVFAFPDRAPPTPCDLFLSGLSAPEFFASISKRGDPPPSPAAEETPPTSG